MTLLTGGLGLKNNILTMGLGSIYEDIVIQVRKPAKGGRVFRGRGLYGQRIEEDNILLQIIEAFMHEVNRER